MGIRKNFDGVTLKLRGETVNSPVLDASGKPVMDEVLDENGAPTGQCKTRVIPQMLSDLVCSVLEEILPRPQGSAPLSIEQKRLRRKIARRIEAGGEQEYTADELAVITNACSESLVTLAFGQIDDFINS